MLELKGTVNYAGDTVLAVNETVRIVRVKQNQPVTLRAACKQHEKER